MANILTATQMPRMCLAATALAVIGLVGCGEIPTTEKSPDTQTPEVKPRLAETGVGIEGQRLEKFDKGVQKMVASPATTLFRTKQKAEFMKVTYAQKLYEASNGKAKSHEEFMKEVIQANNIRLPELPPGQKYEYRPKDGKLWVVPE